MAGIFKSLDQSDVRLTPFRTHKLWYDDINYCDYTNQIDVNVDQVGVMESNNDALFVVDKALTLTIAKHNTSAGYENPTNASFATLDLVRFNRESTRSYIFVVDNGVELHSYDVDLNYITSFTTSHTSPILDVSSDQSIDLIFYCGQSGVGAVPYSGSDFQLSFDLPPLPYTETYTNINAEGFAAAGYAATIHTGSSGTHIVSVQYPNAWNIYDNTAENASCKRIEYDITDGSYYALFENGDLHKWHPGGNPDEAGITILTGVADILADKDVYAMNSEVVDMTRKIHVICNDGQIYTNFNCDYNTQVITVDQIVDTRKWLSTDRLIRASINKNQSGMIGIVGYNIANMIDTVYYRVDANTGEIFDPKHFGAIDNLSIYGENLNTFVGFDYYFNNLFIDLECETTPVFSLYKADYQPISNHDRTDPLMVLFDEGNKHYEYTEPITTNGKYQRVVHRSLEHIYYRNFYDNTRATFGSGNVNTQFRFLEDQAQILSLPQSKFGEGILPESVQITALYNTINGLQQLDLIDDIYGNLIITGSHLSIYGNDISGSIDKNMVGGWPFDKLYRYLDKGPINTTSSFNRGTWIMESTYDNVKFEKLTSPTVPIASPEDLLGVVPKFSAELSSSMVLRPNEVSDYDYMYNFEDGDFAISMMIYPEAIPTHISGSIILSKEGPAEDLRTDENGNLFTIPATRRSPYRISLGTDMSLRFERDTNSEVATASTATLLQLNQLYHIVAMKSGSNLELYLNGTLDATAADVSEPSLCSNKANIYIGNSFNKSQAYTGAIDNIKMFNQALQPQDIFLLRETLGVGNSIVGNVFHNHGMIVLSSIPSRYMDVVNAKARGSHTIWETEISCTVSPGEYTRSNNPTMQEYSSTHNQFVFRSFATGSSFKPFVTTIGLYDDKYRMIAVAKLGAPTQLPSNTDTTIIVRFDR